MTTSDNVLDNIDHALHDWDTSPDAMRWTPEPVAPARLALGELVIPALRVAEVIRDAQEKLARAFTNMATQVIKLEVQIRRLMEDEAQVRHSAMHSEYHRRQKRRKR